MSLMQTITADIMAAMKARENDKLDALRAIKAALLLLQTSEGKSGDITEEEELKLLQKLVKQRRESAEIYKSQNRPDLYEAEVKQADVIELYLPKMLNDDEIRQMVKDVIAQSGATSIKEMGKVMGMVIKAASGKADNSKVSAIVKELLQ